MKIRKKACLHLLLWPLATIASSAPPGTSYTYHGRLIEGGKPANGLYDLRFALLGVSSDGSGLTRTVSTPAVPVTNGLFVALLNFDDEAFDGPTRWLTISVRSNNDARPYTTLLPAQPIVRIPHPADNPDLSGANPGTDLVVGGGLLTLSPSGAKSESTPDAVSATNRADVIAPHALALGPTINTDPAGFNQAFDVTNGFTQSPWLTDIDAAGNSATNLASVQLLASIPSLALRTWGTNNTDLDAALKIRNVPGLPAAVPFFVPLTTNASGRMALDLMVKGTPADRTNVGVSWIDITDSNESSVNAGNFESIRLSKFINGVGQLSLAAGGTGAVRDLILQYYGGRVGIGTTRIGAAYPQSTKLTLISQATLLSGGYSDTVPCLAINAYADGTFSLIDYGAHVSVAGIKQSNGVVYLPKLVVSPAARIMTNQAPLQVSAPTVTLNSWSTNTLAGRATYLFQLAASPGASDAVDVEVLVDDDVNGTWDYSATWGEPPSWSGTFTNTLSLPISPGARFVVTNYSGPGATVNLLSVKRLGM